MFGDFIFGINAILNSWWWKEFLEFSNTFITKWSCQKFLSKRQELCLSIFFFLPKVMFKTILSSGFPVPPVGSWERSMGYTTDFVILVYVMVSSELGISCPENLGWCPEGIWIRWPNHLNWMNTGSTLSSVQFIVQYYGSFWLHWTI